MSEQESAVDRAKEFVVEYGPYLFELMRKVGKTTGVGAFLAAMAPKPAHAPELPASPRAEEQVDDFKDIDAFGKKMIRIKKIYDDLEPRDKKKLDGIFNKKQRRARPSAETWT